LQQGTINKYILTTNKSINEPISYNLYLFINILIIPLGAKFLIIPTCVSEIKTTLITGNLHSPPKDSNYPKFNRNFSKGLDLKQKMFADT